MKKYKLLVMIPAFCLAACSGNDIYGTYSFGMGKEGETNMNASIQFKEDSYAGVEGGKTFVLTVTTGQSDSWVSKILNQGIEGYYTVSNHKHKEYGTRINIGALINSEHYPDIIDVGTELNIPTDLIEKVVTVYCDSKTTTLMLPVSFDDLCYQLVWYGYEIDYTNISFRKFATYKMPGFDQTKKDDAEYEASFLENRLGVHPEVKKDQDGKIISSEIQQMNNNFAYDFARSFVYDEHDNELGAIGKVDSDYYYFSETDEDLSSTFTEYVGNTLATITIDKNVTSPFDNGYKITSVSINATETGDSVLAPEKLDEFFNDPFEFRDFHTLNLGLEKEKGK